MDEFAELKALVEYLRRSLPPLKEHQYQLIGIYMLAALRLGKGEPDFQRCIDDYYRDKEAKERPALAAAGAALSKNSNPPGRNATEDSAAPGAEPSGPVGLEPTCENCAAVLRALKDPASVHANMLRGIIAPITLRQAAHIEGEAAVTLLNRVEAEKAVNGVGNDKP